jgi:hypothetical protein
MNKIYTGIGSRQAPQEILSMISFFSLNLIQKGYTLRSGGAPGADQEFEWAAASSGLPKNQIEELVEIYLPWKSFEEKNRSWITPQRLEAQPEAYITAANFHPRWRYLKHGAKMLHARNVHQIYGYDVTKPILSDFVICWTENGEMKGGTAQALRIAQHEKIKIYNLGDEKQYDELVDWIIDE